MRLIFATCSPDEAEKLVDTLLEERLVACANMIPGVRSHYWWEGEINRDDEVVLFLETREGRVDAAVTRLRELHSYDVPKIIVIDPDQCEPTYSAWIESVTGPS